MRGTYAFTSASPHLFHACAASVSPSFLPRLAKDTGGKLRAWGYGKVARGSEKNAKQGMSCDVIPRTVDRDGEDFRRYNIQGLHERKSRLFRRPCQSTTPGGSGLLAYYRCGYRDVFFYSSHQKKKTSSRYLNECCKSLNQQSWSQEQLRWAEASGQRTFTVVEGPFV